jgi:hypothetical protein
MNEPAIIKTFQEKNQIQMEASNLVPKIKSEANYLDEMKTNKK